MKLTVTTKPLEQISADALIVIHEAGGMLASSANKSLHSHFDSFKRSVERKKSTSEWFCTLERDSGVKTEHLLLESSSFDDRAPHDEPLKMAAARAAADCRNYSLKRLAVGVHHPFAAGKAAAILEGILLGDFNDQRFRNKKTRTNRPQLDLVFTTTKENEKEVRQALERTRAVCEAQNHARELVHTPHHILTPAKLAETAAELAARHGMEAEILDEKELRRQGYEITWQVGRGSEYPPRMAIIRYRPKKPAIRQHIALVGKGITFDSGGLSIKGVATMPWMNYDMGGAAAALGSIEALARTNYPGPVTAILCCAHNAVDGAAYHPGSILTAKNGDTIWVESTDAEGRLVLTDGLHRAGEEGAQVVIDYATLTGAVVSALGPQIGALFTDDEELASLFLHAGETCGDDLWRLPLVREYEQHLSHYLADLSNKASLKTGAGIHAANFLKNFVPAKVRWAHLDIAGPANTKSGYRYFSKGATGYGVRLTLEAMRLLAEGDWPQKEARRAKW